ncbi:MAG: hypothetical protein WC889_00585 [Myxococcota bacterium]
MASAVAQGWLGLSYYGRFQPDRYRSRQFAQKARDLVAQDLRHAERTEIENRRVFARAAPDAAHLSILPIPPRIEHQTLEVIKKGLCRCGIAEAMEPIGFIFAIRPYRLHIPRLVLKPLVLAERRNHVEIPVGTEIIRQRNLVWPVAVDDGWRW